MGSSVNLWLVAVMGIAFLAGPVGCEDTPSATLAVTPQEGGTDSTGPSNDASALLGPIFEPPRPSATPVNRCKPAGWGHTEDEQCFSRTRLESAVGGVYPYLPLGSDAGLVTGCYAPNALVWDPIGPSEGHCTVAPICGSQATPSDAQDVCCYQVGEQCGF